MRAAAAGVVVAVALACAGSVARAEPAGDAKRAPADPDEQEISPDEPEPPPPAPAPTPAPAPKKEAPPSEPAHTMDEVTIPQSFLRFGINFFSDVSAGLAYPERPRTTFAIGTVGVRMLGELGPSLDALAELAFETTSAGPLADVEQVAMRWRRGPGELELGRFHTDLGYWNTAYHHGLWLQIPIERPRALRFEDDGGLIPAHWVGAHYTLQRKTRGGGVAIVLGIGNGRGDIVDDIRVTSDTNEAKAGLLKLRWKRPGFEIGVGFLYDLIAPAAAIIRPALPDQRIHELAGNAYVVVRGAGPVAIAEGYAFRHQAGGRSWMTFAGYGLLGFAVKPWVTPYAALDVISGADEDPFFTPDPATAPPRDVLEPIAGIRFETSTWSALKLELRLTHQPRDPDGEDDYAAAASWSFGL